MPATDLIDKILKGDPRSIARAISAVENGAADAADLMKAVFPHTGKAVVVGITGARVSLDEGLDEYIARVRRFTDLPLVVGFGISRAEHVAQVGAVADGAIVASAMLNRVAEVEDRPVLERVAVIEEFLRGLQPQY